MIPGLPRASAVIAAAGLALVCAGASSARQPPQDVARFTLANGARVLVRPEPASGLVAACVFMRAPNVSEEGQAATGQVLARSLFGANDNLTREAVSRSILALGGGIEVTWQPDYVLVSCVTTPDAFPDAFWLLAQAIKHPVFDEVTVDAARAGASAAARAGETDRLERALAAARRALYAGGPYAQRYDGSDATLRRVTRDAVARHYLQRFAPANTVVSIAGAIDATSARRIVDDQLIDFETPRSRRRRHTPPPPRYAAPSRVAERAPGATVLVLAAYPAPAAGEADYPAAMVLTALLGQGKSSRLFRALRGDSGVGYLVGAEMPALAGPGHLAAFVEYRAERDGKPDADPERTLLQTVRSVLERPPTDAELARARRYAAGAYVLAHQRVRDRAWFAGLFETIAGGWETDRDMASRLGAVTAADVARVATRCLREPVVVVLGPHGAERSGHAVGPGPGSSSLGAAKGHSHPPDRLVAVVPDMAGEPRRLP